MVMTRPSGMTGPVPGRPTLGTLGSSCIRWPRPWPVNSRITPKPRELAYSSMAYPMSPMRFPGTAASIPTIIASCVVAMSRSCAGRDRPDGQRDRGVAAIAVQQHPGVDAEDVALLQRAVVGDAVDGDLVDRGVDAAGEPLLGVEDGIGAEAPHVGHGVVVELARGDAGFRHAGKFL